MRIQDSAADSVTPFQEHSPDADDKALFSHVVEHCSRDPSTTLWLILVHTQN